MTACALGCISAALDTHRQLLAQLANALVIRNTSERRDRPGRHQTAGRALGLGLRLGRRAASKRWVDRRRRRWHGCGQRARHAQQHTHMRACGLRAQGWGGAPAASAVSAASLSDTTPEPAPGSICEERAGVSTGADRQAELATPWDLEPRQQGGCGPRAGGRELTVRASASSSISSAVRSTAAAAAACGRRTRCSRHSRRNGAHT